MKKLILAFILLSEISFGQINDNFSDGDFVKNPEWSGDENHFEINGSHQLHLISDRADTSYLSSSNERINNTSWSFWVKLSFNTSANNFGRIFLVSDSQDLEKPLHGYFLQIGGGDDSIRIFLQNGNTEQPVYCFRHYKANYSTNTLRFNILRYDQGNWEVNIDTSGGTNFFKDGIFSDNTFIQTAWFGVLCKYTSSNSTKFYFDDFIVGPILYDTIPPKISAFTVNDSVCLRLRLTENLNRQEAENAHHYYLTGSGQYPANAKQDPDLPSCVELVFIKPLHSGDFDSLFVSQITDLAGNPIRDTSVEICFYLPRSYDILIHEIMADPEPRVELPEGEYVELYNRTGFPVSLENWTFQFGKSEKFFPDVNIAPHGYLLIVKDSLLFFPFGKCTPMLTSSTSFSNEGSTLIIRDKRKHIIHAVKYESSWYTAPFKNEGGWSLEMIDPMNPCGCKENWTASSSPSGGTPGRENSVYQSQPDIQSPKLERAFFTDSLSMHVLFSEALDSNSMLDRNNYTVFPGEIIPDSIFLVEPFFNAADLKFNIPFHRGIVYRVTATDELYDCTMNVLDTEKAADIAIPAEASPGDIIINEILFNPYRGGSRFVELYNRSSIVFDLKTLILANQDNAEGIMNTGVSLIDESYLLFPREYLCVSPITDDIADRYSGPPDRKFIQPPQFPSLNDDSGIVVLALPGDGTIIDKAVYSSEMQYALLSSKEGVSLERLNPDRASDDRTNWHSAAETSGFATPAYQNSQFFPNELYSAEISIFPLIFSPDNDGKDDVVHIFLKQDNPGFQVDISIYNSRGRLIEKLVENNLVPQECVFTWDGTTPEGNRAPIGFYVFFIELLKPDGTVRHYKKTIVLAGAL